jgi:hypothetical protein
MALLMTRLAHTAAPLDMDDDDKLITCCQFV